jgi:MYXO-CTERM domain-containing protein
VTTDGATVDSAFIDGPNLTDTSADDQALIKFSNIFTNQGGTVPNSATILSAYLAVDTASAVSSINVHTPGDFSVNRMLVDWNTTSLFTDFGGDGPTEAQNEIGPALDVTGAMIADARAFLDVTAAVNAWKSGESNFGLNLRSVDTADGWSIKFTGSDSPPQLIINYTTDVITPTEDADFDADGDVDGADFLTWQRGVGTASGGTLAQGDANGDGAINATDLGIWKSQFGPGAVAAVPEPTSAALAAIVVAAGAFIRRRRG